MANDEIPDRVRRMRRVIAAKGRHPALEANVAPAADMEVMSGPLEPAVIKEVVARAETELNRIVKEYLDDGQREQALVKRIVSSGTAALRLVGKDEEEGEFRRQPELLASLEAIVLPDGSRPSFLIKEGRIDERSGRQGTWEGPLGTDSNDLEKTIACVGRIDDPSLRAGYGGTGVLVAENLILTNRHVVQAIARREDENRWQLHDGTCIDFGHEYRGWPTLRRRKLKAVVFVGNQSIDPNNVDHTKLDLAAIELEPALPAERPRFVLNLNAAANWSGVGPRQIYTIGYPFKPEDGEYTPTLLDQLFSLLFSYKRLAPGDAISSRRQVPEWTLTHDATTLGGNSGSAMVQVNNSFNVVAIHYGGVSSEPAENWGHVLGLALPQAGETGDRLATVLDRFGVIINNS